MPQGVRQLHIWALSLARRESAGEPLPLSLAAPMRPHGGPRAARMTAGRRKTAGRWGWGGLDSNQRPADYEFDPVPLRDQGKSANNAPDQHFRLPSTARRFAILRSPSR